MVRQYNENMAWQQAQASRSSSGGGGSSGSGGSGGNNNNQDTGGTVDIAAEYLAMKKAGAKTTETDSFLKAAISEGLISQRDATELRNTRY